MTAPTWLDRAAGRLADWEEPRPLRLVEDADPGSCEVVYSLDERSVGLEAIKQIKQAHGWE
jgi:hypothetical protein